MKQYFSVFAVLLALFAAATPPALGAWAVAIAPGGEPIVARNYIGTGDAKKHALEDCNKLYANCAIVETANTACLSLANDGTNWGIGKAYNPTNSGEKALAACAAITTRTCKVVHNFCGV